MPKQKYKLTGEGTPFNIQDEIGFIPADMFEKAYSFSPTTAHHLFVQMYKTIPCRFTLRINYSYKLVEFLKKNGQLITDETGIESDEQEHYGPDEDLSAEYSAWFHYKKCFIYISKITLGGKQPQDCFKLDIYHAVGTIPPVDDFKLFTVKKKKEFVINTVIKTNAGLDFHPFEVNVPKAFNIIDNYGAKFESIHDNIVESLQEKVAGLYLFHGSPGTGKTTYLKYLSSKVKREMIYIPTSSVDSLGDPAFTSMLLDKKGSIIVIEDAEKALLNRESSDSASLVSTILNLTDGILGDIFKASIIATYNSPKNLLDKALMRKGRLKMEYEFSKLSVEDAQRLLDKLGKKHTTNKAMSLAEIYNLEVENITSEELIAGPKVMGFGAK